MEIIRSEKDIVFRKKALLPLRDYTVFAPREGVLLSWIREVDELKQLLVNRFSANQLKEKIERIKGNDHLKIDPDCIRNLVKGMIHNNNFDDETATLLSIGLFTLHKKPRWEGVRGFTRVIIGGNYYLETFPDDETINCIDIASWIKLMADHYRIEGNIVSEIDHSYYESASGKILDPMEAPRVAGFFATKNLYRGHMDWLDSQRLIDISSQS